MTELERQAIETWRTQRGVVAMVGYYISHKAHHRGGTLLTMKQSGIRIPVASRMNIRELNKI